MKKIIALFQVSFLVLVMSACAHGTKGDDGITADQLPLTINIQQNEFNVGDILHVEATLQNNSGKPIRFIDNGLMPCVFLTTEGDGNPHVDTTVGVQQTLAQHEKLSKSYDIPLESAGTFLLVAHHELSLRDIQSLLQPESQEFERIEKREEMNIIVR